MGYMTSQYRKVEPARIEQRGAMRHAVLLQRATVRRRKAEPVEAHLSDLSIYGCRLAIPEAFKSGDRITLSFADNEPVAATTIWCEGGLLGCKFDEAIDRALFRSLTLLTA